MYVEVLLHSYDSIPPWLHGNGACGAGLLWVVLVCSLALSPLQTPGVGGGDADYT